MVSSHSRKKQFVIIIHINEPGLRDELLDNVHKESLSSKQVIIPGSIEIKHSDQGITKMKGETVVLLTYENVLERLTEILYKLELLGKETIISYDVCPDKVLAMLGLSND